MLHAAIAINERSAGGGAIAPRAAGAGYGSRTLCYHFGNAASDWHVVAVGEMPDRDGAFALANAVCRQGGVVQTELHELFTGAEADTAVAKG